jgi:probable HAF family extracellular repeat protein
LRLETLEGRTLLSGNPVAYSIQDLGLLPGGNASYATAINNLGQVAGYTNTDAFLYGNGVMTDLGTLGGSSSAALGMNDSGTVVGWADSAGDTTHGFLYTNGTMVNLTPGSFTGGAQGINGVGQVVGWYSYGTSGTQPFLYSNGVKTNLGTFPTGSATYTLSINDSGQVVGYTFQPGLTGEQPFLIENGTTTIFDVSGAFQMINASGQVVGGTYLSNTVRHALLYSNGTMNDLGTLGGSNSWAYGINTGGKVVGDAYTTSGAQHAFLYANGTMVDLNNLIPSNSGWVLKTATAINDSGQIVGYGIGPSSPNDAYLLTPVATGFTVSGFPSPVTAGTAGSFTVTAKDTNGHIATGYTGTVNFTSTDRQAVLPADYTFNVGDAGVHMFRATLKTAGSQSITATDRATGSITGSINLVVRPGSVDLAQSTVTVVSSTIGVGTSTTVTLTARDGYGNQENSGGLPVEFHLGSGTSGGILSTADGLPTNRAIDNGNGTYTLIFTGTTIGSATTITATIGGDAVTSTLPTITVTGDATLTTVTSSLNPSVVGQFVTLTATVSASFPVTSNPTGTVTFLDGGATLGTASLSAGSASLTTTMLSLGVHTIQASYVGDSNFGSSVSLAILQTVNRRATTTMVASSANPSVYGNPLTYTATVSAAVSGTGTPTGTVTYILDGSTTLGTGTLNGAGVATYTTTASQLSAGTHTITATYEADSNFSTSTSAAITQTVNKESSSTGLTSSLNPSPSRQSITFTVMVSGPGQPTGTVTFLDGTSTLGTQSLSNGNAAISTSTLSAGTHSISVSYSGDANFNASTSAALLQIVSAGFLTRFAAAGVFSHSEEHYIDFVSHLYVTYLRRAADVPGLLGWVQPLYQRLLTDEQVEANFLISPEYVNNHGGFVLATQHGSAPGTLWVTALYIDILHRTPSASELQGWVNGLELGESALSVADVFVGGVEKEQQNIIDAYHTFLGRDPSQMEVVGYINAFQSPVTPPYTIEDLRRDFVSSPEYYSRPTKGNGNDSTWVISAYQDVLSRAPSGHELNDIWVPILAAQFTASVPLSSPAPVAIPGSSGLPDVAQVFARSQAHYIDFVSSLYKTELGRAATVPELVENVNQLFFGQTTDERVTAQLLGTSEYVNNHGGFTNNLPGQNWVIGIYRDVLSRPPTQTEIQNALNALAAGQPPFAVALTITDGTGNQTDEILDAFMSLLGQAPSSTEIQQNLTAFQNGVTVENLRGMLVGSSSYFSSPLKGNGDDATWVRSAYGERDILFRMSSDHEVNDIWVPILQRS